MEQLINITDAVFLGHVGEIELGASAIAGIYYLAVYMLGFGFSIGLQVMIARKNGEELGFLDQSVAIDMDLGDADDFEICLPQEEWTKERYWYGNRIFVPRTEYGGILNSLEVMT